MHGWFEGRRPADVYALERYCVSVVNVTRGTHPTCYRDKEKRAVPKVAARLRG
jgi:hypothetical protein